jgi:outer membrane protein assembly factor BamB
MRPDKIIRCFVLTFSVLLVISNSVLADWPLSRGNSSSTGATAQTLPEKLEILWEYQVKGLGFDAGPIIADGMVFAADADGNVLALNLKSGSELWKKKFEAGYLASPAYHAGTVYLGDMDGMLRAFDPKSGEQKWEYDLKREIDAGANFFGDKVLVTSQSGSLVAVSQADGKLQWQYETGDQLQCGPSLADKLTFLGGCDQHLHIVDVESGKPVAEKIPIEAPTGSTPSISGSTVLVPNYKGQIWAFESPSNKLLWKFEDQKLANEFKNSVAIADGIVVANSGNRRVFALELSTGRVLWEQSVKRRSDSSPVIAGKQVIIAGTDGRVLRFELTTGKELPVIELKGSFLGSPAIADGKIVLASDRGDIYCLGEKK